MIDADPVSRWLEGLRAMTSGLSVRKCCPLDRRVSMECRSFRRFSRADRAAEFILPVSLALKRSAPRCRMRSERLRR